MSKPLPLLGAIVFMISASCSPAAPPVDVEAERAALTEADSRYGSTAATRDLETFLAFYASDAAMYPPEGATVTGLDNIRSFAGAFFADPAFSATFRSLAVEVSQDGDMGYTLSTGDLAYTGPDGNLIAERIRDFHVWRKQADGTWKIVVDIWNLEPAAPVAQNQ